MDRKNLLHFNLRSYISHIIKKWISFMVWMITQIWQVDPGWQEGSKKKNTGTAVTVTKDGQRIYTRQLNDDEAKLGMIIPENAFEVLSFGKQLSNNGKCVGYRPGKGKPFVWLSYQEVIDRSKDFGAGLLTLGARSNCEFLVGIFAKTCVEWTVADYGCLAYGLVTAPLYDALGPEACLQIIDTQKIEILVCGGETQIKAVLPNGQSPASLRVIVTIEKLDDNRIAEVESYGIKVLTVQEVESLGRLNPRVITLAPSDSLVSLIFTSGTTGAPKGAMLTHANFLLALKSFLQAVTPVKLTPEDSIVGYLPLVHIMERLWERAIHLNGGKVGYLSGDIADLMKDCQELKPTCFAFVPRILSRLHDQILADLNRNIVSRLIGKSALMWKLHVIRKGDFKTTFFDRFVFKKYQKLLGGKVRVGLTGSAAIDGGLLNFARTVFGCYIFECYGQTEAGGPVTSTRFGDFTEGHVGEPFVGVQIKMEDVPDMGYFSKDACGEICCKSPFVMKGYYGMPEKTAEAIDEDGWLHSGDIGAWTAEGKLKVIDRKKHIFKLSQGEYVAPERLESIYGRSKFVISIFVDGESLYPFPVALICPNHEEFLGYPENVSESVVISKITQDLMKLAVEGKLKSYEVPKRIHLLKEPFTVENGCLTQTQKTRREIIRNLFRHEIKALYSKT